MVQYLVWIDFAVSLFACYLVGCIRKHNKPLQRKEIVGFWIMSAFFGPFVFFIVFGCFLSVFIGGDVDLGEKIYGILILGAFLSPFIITWASTE